MQIKTEHLKYSRWQTMCLHYLIFVTVLLSCSTSAYGQSAERNYFDIPYYNAAGINNNRFTIPRYSGSSPQEVCNKSDAEFRQGIESMSGEINLFEVAPVQTVFVDDLSHWRCVWDITTTLLNHNPPIVIESSPGIANIGSSCQDPDQTGSRPNHISFSDAFPRADEEQQRCYCRVPYIFNDAIQWCDDTEVPPEKDCTNTNSENTTTNPCDVATGRKYRSELDVTSGAFTFTRSYNSGVLTNIGLGVGWSGSYDKFLHLTATYITVSRPSGRSEAFSLINDRWVGDSDTNIDLSQVDGPIPSDRVYRLVFQDEQVEIYDFRGYLIGEVDSKGNEISVHNSFTSTGYDFRQFRDQYGQGLFLGYQDGLLVNVKDLNAINYYYEYDENKNLISVIYPDTTPNDDADNPRKVYHYENTDFPNHLTGITDENGDRYATFAYDENGKAISSELGQTTNTTGQQRVDLDYQGDD